MGEDHAEGGVREHFAEQKRKAIVKTSSVTGRTDIKNKNSVKFIWNAAFIFYIMF